MRVWALLVLVVQVGVPAAPAFAAAPPAIAVNVVEARTHPDGKWWGENATHFRAAGLQTTLAEGTRITWTLEVRRKLARAKTAKSWLVGKHVVSHGMLHDVAFALLYSSFAKARFQPGEHVATFVATTSDGREVYRGDIGFMLPAVGPNAYNPRDFAKPARRR